MINIEEALSTLKKGIEEIPGYRLSNTHYRLGSKIHISDFYYAKRMFQNSYFASRFAFQVTRQIQTDLLPCLQNENRKISLIGYGLYSELLLSFICKFLKILHPNIDINTNFVDDSDKLELIKGSRDLHENAIIIVPIASTFSTSIKIKEMLERDNPQRIINHKPEIRILEPHINILVIMNESEFNIEEPNGVIPEEKISWVARAIGWKEINKACKEVRVSGIENEQLIRQKYSVCLPSNWHSVSDCKLCFPAREALKGLETSKSPKGCSIENCVKCKKKDDAHCIRQERCLFTTDKASVTPTLIFGKPQPRITNNDRQMTMEPGMITYGHRVHFNKHYKYYFNSQIFFSKNQVTILSWLEEDIKKRGQIGSLNKHVLLFAPGHFTNTSFVDLVNSVLFANTATIIHYDTSNEHVQNFSLFYKKYIDEAENIYFVDDFLDTGESFTQTNRLLKQCIGKDEKERRFDGCIVMLNRTNWNVEVNILGELKSDRADYKLMSFANLYQPPLNDTNMPCPLCEEKKKYTGLIESSVLNRLKFHYEKQLQKICKNEKRHEEDSEDPQERSSDKYIKRLEAIHRTYTWFATQEFNPSNSFATFYDWVKNLLNNTRSPFTWSPFVTKDLLYEQYTREIACLDDFSAEVIKVLTQAPFSDYVVIRKIVFQWVKELLFEQMIRMKNGMDEGNLTYKVFRDFKFLLRRAGTLHMSMIISRILMELLEQFCGYTKKLQEAENQEKADEDQANFHIFYIAQVKELLYEDEIKSIHLEKIISEFENRQKEKSQMEVNSNFSQLLRLLRYENNGLINSHRKFILSFPNREDADKSYHKNSVFNNFTAQEPMTKKLVKEYFDTFDEIAKRSPNNDKLLEDIFAKLQNFIGVWKGYDFVKHSDIGAFLLLVKRRSQTDNREDAPIPIYNSAKGINDVTVSNDPYLKSFISGIEDYPNSNTKKCIVEFERKDDRWIDLYQMDEELFEAAPQIYNETYNRLLLLRVSKEITINHEDSPLALIGFFYNNQSGVGMIEAKATRFLAMLISPLSNFIQNHIDTIEFFDYYNEKNKLRLSFLMTHGRLMIKNMANDSNNYLHKQYKNIGNALEDLQFIMMHYEDSRKRKDRIENLFFMRTEYTTFATIGELHKIFSDILKNEYVENRLEDNVVKPVTNIDFGIFPFPRLLLKVICFELFVNAKKNRWLFKDYTQVNGHQTNTFSLDYNYTGEQDQKQLEIKVSNTGPAPAISYLREMNSDASSYKLISGLGLIKALLKDLDMGTLSFAVNNNITPKSENPDIPHFVEITAKLTLKCSFGHENCDY